MPELLIDNFKLAQRRDGALREDRLWSLYTLKNLDVIYVDGRLEVRKGSAYWNDTELPAEPTQIYWWRNLQGQEHLLAICSDLVDRWYVVKETGAHVLLIDELAISQCVVAPVNNRLIVGTDHNLFWTDNDAIGGATHSYRLGIKKPVVPFAAVSYVTEGTHSGAVYPTTTPTLNSTTVRRYAAKLTVTQTQRVKVFKIGTHFSRPPDFTTRAAYRLSIYTDVGGQPGVLVSDDAVSAWVDGESHGLSTWGLQDMILPEKIELVGGTSYWAVLDGDDSYYTNYSFLPAHIFALFVGHIAAPPAGEALRYDAGTGTWIAFNRKLAVWVGGTYEAEGETPFVGSLYYDYVMTYVNTTYQIESRPSDPLRIRVTATDAPTFREPNKATVELRRSIPSDPQVDAVRFYRREVGDDPSVEDPFISDTYKLVSEDDVAVAPVIDTTPTAYLGTTLQSEDHYCYDDTEAGEDSKRPVQLVPYGGCEWKGRFWFFELDSNVLYMSKILEEDGATGMTGDSIYDYFTLDNRLDMPVPSSIIAIRPIGEDQLGVYFQDESVWVIWGCNEPLNPPSDIMMQPFLTDNGLIGPAAIGDMLGRHVYLSRDGLRSFGGSVAPLRGVSSETNQTILDDIQEQYLENSVIVTFGPEIWLLVDTDNDGTLDTVMILDLQREVPSREIVDRAWRMYEFPEGFNDLTVRKTGTDFRSIYASSAESNNIIELLTGATDLGNAIACEFETHDMRAKNMAAVYELRLQGSYPGTPPVFTIQATSHAGNTISRTLSPQSSSDIRRSKTGIRINRPVSIRAKVNFSSSESDQILSLAVGFLGD